MFDHGIKWRQIWVLWLNNLFKLCCRSANCYSIWLALPSILNSWTISNNAIGSDSGSNSYLIQLISSAITITNSTQISNQYYILWSFVSAIAFQDFTLASSSFIGAAIQVIGSTLYFNNVNFLEYNGTDTVYHSRLNSRFYKWTCLFWNIAGNKFIKSLNL